MRRFALLPFAVGVALLAVALRLDVGVASANLLANGDFEQWHAGGAVGWLGPAVPAEGAQGQAALLSGASPVQLVQLVPIVDGGTYMLRFEAQPVAGAPAAVAGVVFLDGGGQALTSKEEQFALTAGEWRTLSLSVVAPAGAEHARIQLGMEPTGGPAAVVYDSASFALSLPLPTPTPPEPTPTVPPATTSTSTATSTATPGPKPTAPPTPKPPAGGATATPRSTSVPSPAEPDDGDWGLLRNGGFEVVDGNQPAYWSKFGGNLLADGAARSGKWAATLSSSTSSVKWVHQVVPVSAGEWYEANVDARIVYGQATAFIRISWYRSADGSGSSFAQDDSNETTSSHWSELATGRLAAPPGARSARLRLMLRPLTASSAAVSFDNARFALVDPPTPPATNVRVPLLAADDLFGGERRHATRDIAWRPRQELSAGDLRISEVASDPPEPGRDTAYEWVELENVGTTPVDLAGWRLGETNQLDELPAYVVPPGGFVVIAAQSAQFPEGVPVVRVPDGDIGKGLNNTGDVVRLLRPDGSQADAVSYGDDTSVSNPAPPAPRAGETLARGENGAWRRTTLPSPGNPNTFHAAPSTASARAETTQPGSAGTQGAVTRDNDTEAHARIEIVEGAEEQSPVPWILLGAAGGAGAVAGAVGAGKAWSQRRRG